MIIFCQYPTSIDLKAFEEAPKVDNLISNTFDYSGVLVPKPWGHEFLWAQDDRFATWLLSISSGHATSMHCHEHKATVLTVLSGQVTCSTLSQRHFLSQGDSIFFAPKVFHSTKGIIDSEVIEVETPPLKGDLVRLTDGYGRIGKGYEAPETYGLTIPPKTDKVVVNQYVEQAKRLLNENQGS